MSSLCLTIAVPAFVALSLAACGEGTCTVHRECEGTSNVCGPDGACIDEQMVAYVAAEGTGTTETGCTKNSACPTLIAAVAVKEKPYIKITGDVTTGDVIDTHTTRIGRSVTILGGPGARLTRSGVGTILLMQHAPSISIFDLEISGQTGSNYEAVKFAGDSTQPVQSSLSLVRVNISRNEGPGIWLLLGGTLTITQSTISENVDWGILADDSSLTVTQSTISGNGLQGITASGGSVTVTQSMLSGNGDGGIAVTASTSFNITNTFIVRNGGRFSGPGGAWLEGVAEGSVFAFNTVADNRSRSPMESFAGGLFCNIAGFSASSNLVVRNSVGDNLGETNSNVGGDCDFSSSTIATEVAGVNFRQPDEAPYDYHINPGSTAVDQGTMLPELTVDVDGESRRQGDAPDRGADELSP